MKINVPYGITVRLARTSLTDARTRVTDALKSEGFGVLTEIDVQATLKTKIDATVDPYVILGACNPRLAHQALLAEPGVGLLLPCNIVLTADGADTVVSAASPKAMFAVAQLSPALAHVAAEANLRITRAIHSLEGAPMS